MRSIESTLVELLTMHKMKIATAESCTGGLIAQKITSVPGASKCFDCGVVTYSNEQIRLHIDCIYIDADCLPSDFDIL